MIGKEYKTIYPGIVPKGSIGRCVDVVNTYVYAFKIVFKNGETLWFMKRDLAEVEK